MSAFALPISPAALAGPPSQSYGTLRYRVSLPKKRHTLSFGSWLEPRYIFGAGTLGLSAAVFFTLLSLLMSAFALLIPPGALTGHPSQAYRTLLYNVYCYTSAASVDRFSPDTFSAQKPLFRPVSCYAFFK